MTIQKIAGVPQDRIEAMIAAEAAVFRQRHPRSAAALGADARGAGGWLNAVPMHWMTDWPQPFAPVIDWARGARICDIDGVELDDFCLGDTGAMFGHSPAPVARAIRAQAGRGLTAMLPSAQAGRVAGLLCDVFGPMRWQVAMTATDANRFALATARAITGRRRVLVFDGAYHGTLADAMIARDATGCTVNRPGLMGVVRDLSMTGVAAAFNDLASVEAALAGGDVAAILTEPVMTNSCMVLPEAGFHAGLRRLADRHGALLMIDETHTISSGRGGYTRRHGLAPDMLVAGKCIAGGLPAAVWGLNEKTAAAYHRANAARPQGHSGMGTTLAANPLQMAALAACLGEVMTAAAYARMEAGAGRLKAGLAAVLRRHGAPWHVVRVGARVEFICAPGPLANGAEAARAHQPRLEGAIHAALFNRHCLIAPFHNMMLVSPVTTRAQIDRLVAAFDAVLAQLFGSET